MQALYKGYAVKPIPNWLRFVPLFGTNLAFAAWGKIYLPKEMYKRFISNNHTSYDESVLIHESVHVKRQKEQGVFLWTLKYLFSKKHKLEEELLAIKKQMLFLKSHDLQYDVESKAKQFSGATYLWLMSEKAARELLGSIWRNA